jgi:hypothetical protein
MEIVDFIRRQCLEESADKSIYGAEWHIRYFFSGEVSSSWELY